jgi:CheY-like chemotaxis protein
MSEPQAPWSPGVMLGRRILVVDDDEDERLLLANYLQQEGCRVYLANDGKDGLQKAMMVNPDLILMDVGMPVCDGLTACRALQQDPRTRDIPVIFLTGAARPNDRVSGLRAGAVDYVTKPFVFDEVRLRLIVHLRLRQLNVALTLVPSEASGVVSRAMSHVPTPASSLDTILFQSARGQMLQQLGRTPNLAELASTVGTNTKRLNEAFRKCVGTTVFEFLREERMRESCVLLRDTALEVQAIAMDMGFSGGANFSTAFKERFGLSPSDFRVASGRAMPTDSAGSTA